jgi:uncharacterized protein (TIGR00251 family)
VSVRFAVRVQPRASRSEIVGKHGEALKVRIAAPPVEGAANSELVALLAKRLGVTKSAVRIVRGEQARDKLVEVDGVSEEAVRQLVG